MIYNYLVNDIYSCVQGEGCLTGTAMVLLRLHGCEVGCPWCDTKETWQSLAKNEVNDITEALGATPYYARMTQLQIVSYIKETFNGLRWILVTGGEPADQYLYPLQSALNLAGYKTALETSGTALGHLKAGFDWVCVSPKIDMPGGKKVLPQALKSADEIKMVIGKQQDIDLLDGLIEQNNMTDKEICLQPVSQSKKATQLCLKTVQERGWRLSLQIHKYLEVR